jgi:hypothetical protein
VSVSIELAKEGAIILINLVLVIGVLVVTFGGLGLLVSGTTILAHWFAWPSRWLGDVSIRRSPVLEWISLLLQYAVGTLFFLTFVYQIGKQNGHFAASEFFKYTYTVVALTLVLGVYYYWKAGRFLPHVPKNLSRIIYYHRRVKPIWDWVAYQSYSLLWLDRIPLLRPVVEALDDAVRRINHRRWQIFLRCTFAFSIFTLPVQLFPGFDKWVFDQFDKRIDWNALVTAVAVPAPVAAFWGAFLGTYIYLWDWVVTIFALFFAVAVLSPLEAENLFPTIGDALNRFVRTRGPFEYICYFWQRGPGEYAETSAWPERQILRPDWEGVAKSLHNQTIALDKSLPFTWQGVNSRVSAVFDDEAAPDGPAYCVHYRRFGESAFVVAVGADPDRFEGNGTLTSQSDFLQLSESIGSLVNVRHSLKSFGPHFAARNPS